MTGRLRITAGRSLGVILLLLAPALRAERYALLIGIGTYSNFPAFHLSGPAEDVPALRNSLVHAWHFQERNVRVLVDGDATRAHILGALDALVGQVQSGDEVFIYYSGHGTSALDPKNPHLGLPLNTGALIPADVRKAPPAGLLPQFIVGATDLKPRLRALDQRASVFVVIDACYSGAAVKSVADSHFRARSVPLAAMARGGSMEDDYDADYQSVRVPKVDPDDYPYQHLVFLSAAAQSEKALEAGEDALRTGIFQTVDGKPHGLLTDSLLRSFRGEGDENHDGVLTYEELRQFALERVMNLGQTPQLLPRNAPGVTAQPVFGIRAVQLAQPGPAAARHEGVSVRLSPGAQNLAAALARFPEVRIVEGEAADLAIARTGDRYELYIGNGVRIRDYAEGELPGLLERVRREPWIRTLREWSFPAQAFHGTIEAVPANRDAYAAGEAVEFRLTADRRGYLLLLNIDVTGEVTVVYRSEADRPEPAGQPVSVATCITPPTGSEFMKLFAFETQPAGWAALQLTGVPADGAAVRKFLEWLRGAPPTSAQAAWLTYSTDRRQPEGGRCAQ